MIHYKKPVNLVPFNDDERVKELNRYEILDTPAEKDFDTIALLAAEIFETDAAFVAFVDRETIFFKAGVGDLPVGSIARRESLCALAILEKEVTVFHDTRQIPEFAASPYLSDRGEPRFYAAAQIRNANGFAIGTVCVTDKAPRLTVSETQLKALQLLADLVMERLEVRLAHKTIVKAYHDNLHLLVHDMKNPVTSISLYAQLLGANEMAPEKVNVMAKRIKKSTEDLEQQLNTSLTRFKR